MVLRYRQLAALRLRGLGALALCAAILTSCTQTIPEMRERFAQSVQRAESARIDELVYPQGTFLWKRKPEKIVQLPNGNKIFVYPDYWGLQQGRVQRIGPCAVFLEVDPDTSTVVEARAEGAGCYMPW